MVKLYNRSNVIGAFSALNSISIGYENNNARTIQFTDNGNTISFQLFNLQEIIGSVNTVTYTPIDTTSTGPDYNARVFEVFDFLSSQVFQGFSPGPTYVGGVVAAYPNFASFPVTGTQSVIYIDEAENSAYYWDGTSYQLLVSTGVEQYASFALFPVTGSANVIYIDMSVPEPYVWDGTAYLGLNNYVAWGNITGTLSAQTDLQAALDAKFDDPTGTTAEYIRGDGTLATFPTITSGTVTSVDLTAGTGISVSGGPITSSGSITVTNSAPDQTVALTAGTGIGITGTYPNFTITNSSPSTGGTVTSVGMTVPSAFSVTPSTITSSGTFAVTGAGVTSQYVRGDGTLANFPSSTGGGASLSYYLNGSVGQGTFGGVGFKEMDKTPVLGAGTDFTINANGYIQSFITDANVPNQLEIPAGNWNFETYFSASSGGGSPSFYVELYKWNGATLSLIASNSAVPEGITNGTAIDAYFSALAVPQTTLAATDRLAIRIYVTHAGKTITLHTENSHLCEVITTFSTGLTALNGLTAQVQNFAVGTTGTDFAISSATSTHTFNLPTASAANRGALSSTDWNTFNGKFTLPTLTSGSVLFSNGTTIAQNNANFFWDNTNNRLGVGTATPAYRIDAVAPQFGGYRLAASTATFLMLDTTTTSFTINHSNTETSLVTSNFGPLYFKNNGGGQTRLSLFANGNIAIGTTTDAGFKLDVNGRGRFVGATAASGLVVTGGPSGNDVNLGGIIFLGTDTFYKGSFIYSYDSKLLTINGGDVDGNIAFKAATNERMRINSSGNVGIGTSTDAGYKLDVNGTARISSSFRVDGQSTFNSSIIATSGVRIGSDPIAASARLDVQSTTQGFLPPRMTNAQKLAIASPVAGLVVYDSTTNKLCCYNGTTWNDLF
jgi:hypothetical protein